MRAPAWVASIRAERVASQASRLTANKSQCERPPRHARAAFSGSGTAVMSAHGSWDPRRWTCPCCITLTYIAAIDHVAAIDLTVAAFKVCLCSVHRKLWQSQPDSIGSASRRHRTCTAARCAMMNDERLWHRARAADLLYHDSLSVLCPTHIYKYMIVGSY